MSIDQIGTVVLRRLFFGFRQGELPGDFLVETLSKGDPRVLAPTKGNEVLLKVLASLIIRPKHQ